MERAMVILSLAVVVASAVPAASAQVSYADFSDISGLTLTGDSVQQGAVVNLTPEIGDTGGVWATAKQGVAGGFSTTFTFRITDVGSQPGQHDIGGDGLAFVIQNTDGNAAAGGGGGMGYEGLANSLAVEFDTYYNLDEEPNQHHVSVQSCGLLPNAGEHDYTLGFATTDLNLESGAEYDARIVYQTGVLTIYLDDLANPLLTVNVNIDELLDLDNGSAWVGFTASTGAAWGDHQITSWSYVPEPASLCLLGVGGLAILRRRGR